MEPTKSCWCGNNQLISFSPEYFACTKCGTLVSQAGLTIEETQVETDEVDFYGKEYWLSHQTQDYGFPDIYQRARQDLPERCVHWLQTLLRYKSPPASVLELGCGHGGSVALLQWAGFGASGLEMSPWVVEFARKTFDIPMLVGRVEEQQIAPESLDAIVLYDVLEHLPDPLATMQFCASLLKADGILIVQMPNYEESKRYEAMVEQNDIFLEQMKPIEHLHLFSHRATQQFFKRLEFNYLEFKPALFAYDMFLVTSRQPLVEQTDGEIEESLLESASGRVIQALLDQTNELHQLQSAHQELAAQYQSSESDRADRLQVIETQGQALVDLQAVTHQTQMVMEQYRTQLESVLEQLQQSRSELQQTQGTLQQTQGALQQTQGELQQTQGALQQTQDTLRLQQTQLMQTQTKLEKSRSRVDRQQQTITDLQQKAADSQEQIHHLEQEIAFLSSGKGAWKTLQQAIVRKMGLGKTVDP